MKAKLGRTRASVCLFLWAEALKWVFESQLMEHKVLQSNWRASVLHIISLPLIPVLLVIVKITDFFFGIACMPCSDPCTSFWNLKEAIWGLCLIVPLADIFMVFLFLFVKMLEWGVSHLLITFIQLLSSHRLSEAKGSRQMGEEILQCIISNNNY